MHTLQHFLILLLVTLPFTPIPYPLLVEARWLNSNGFLEVELIHRDSPHSPYYSPSGHHNNSRPFGSISSNHHIQLSSAHYDSKVVQTDIIPNGGDYLMKISIGTPPVDFTAVADTGSDLVWVQCSPCQQCFKSSLFDPTQSSTYQALPCDTQSCNFPDINSDCAQNENNNGSCSYLTKYGDGTTSSGVLGQDTITLSSSDSSPAKFPSTTFGCGYDQDGQVGTQGDGIAGLGNGQLSLVSQLGQDIDNKFAYCLTPFSSGTNSKLRFGVDVSGSNAVTTSFTSKDPSTFYYLTLDEISVGNTPVPVSQDIIIDSGTTLTYLDSSAYEGLRDAMTAAIKLDPVEDPNGTFNPCYQTTGSLGAPDVVFKFKGADVVLKEENLFRSDGSVTCFTVVPTESNFIFGNIAQVNFEVGYDMQANTVTFAPADCTTY